MNRLSSEASPYLLQHADNPVDWLPWGEEALERARRQDKPIFLSIGYAACHWCHVMAHESFEDEGTAAILNQHFIPVKVDREERPDVDAVYMDAVVALTGQGGWPLSVFLTPAGEPFYGGTYFPPERRHGLPSFRELLETIAASWRDDRSRIQEAARRLTEHVAGSAATAQEATDLDPSLEGQAMEALLRQYDWDQGGWGGAPKFPQAPVTDFLLRRHHRTQDPMAVEMATHCLRAMANGGLFDHVGGGFHRYAVDRTWTVPHFEKMLYDNALLGRAYLEAWLVTGQPPLLDAATATLAFMQRELLTPQGAFGASLDADSEGEEGRFYVWSLDELRAAFTDPDDLALLQHAFDLQPGGNFEGKIVLRRAQDDEAVAATLSMEPDQVRRKIQAAVHRLREVRSSRVRPALDDKILAGWNGLALGAWASAARILRRPDDLNIAQTLADFLLTAMSPGGRLHRAWRMGVAKQPAFLADLAAVASGLLDLYQVDFNPRWLNASRQLAGEILSQFADPAGGFFDTAADQAALIARPKTLQDTPIPSGGAQATCLFLRLEALTGEPRYRQAALGALGTTLATAIRYPAGFSVWLQAAALAHEPLPQLVIAGDPDSQGFQALAHEAYRFFQPRLVIAGGEISGQDLPLLSGKVAMEGRPTAYLCRDFSCDAPTISPETLAGQLRGLR